MTRKARQAPETPRRARRRRSDHRASAAASAGAAPAGRARPPAPPRDRLRVLIVVLVQVAATMAAPWLIGVAIDRSLPQAPRRPLRLAHRRRRSRWSAAPLLSGWLRAVFVLRSGEIGQDDPVRPAPARRSTTSQALSVSFHERFTSGRVISRLTSDVDTLDRVARLRVWTGCSPPSSTSRRSGAAARSSTCRSRPSRSAR